MMRTRINQIDVSEKFVQLFDEKFSKNIDSLQSVFDGKLLLFRNSFSRQKLSNK